jgi:hypothetical protein
MSKDTAVAAFPRIEGAPAIAKAIASIASRGKNLDRDIHIAGVSALAHAATMQNGGHGDPSLLDKLVAALPNGSRKAVLVEWILAFGQVRKLVQGDAADNERIKAGGFFALDKGRKLDLEGAQDKPWHEMRRQQDPRTAFDVQAAVASLVSRINGAAAKGMTIENREAALAELRTAMKLLQADVQTHPDGTHHEGDKPTEPHVEPEPVAKVRKVKPADMPTATL